MPTSLSGRKSSRKIEPNRASRAIPFSRQNLATRSCFSSASARGLNRRRLLATKALLKTGEDLVGRDGRDSAGIDVFDAALDLGFPVLTKVSKVETCRELVD